jgi:2-polyprenyl-6-methoxyphenol hydroxylase-like FAD-dependent oxidoreductase
MTNSQFPQVGIIGAGIAGLSSAIALRRAGWQCEVFERSSFKNEIGAAITVTPNASRCLERWEFDFIKSRPVENRQFRMMAAGDLQIMLKQEYPDLEQQFGFKAWSFHRVDLHEGLLDLAVEQGEEMGPPAIIRLGCEVYEVDFEEGKIILGDGTSIEKDLIVVADGAHVGLTFTKNNSTWLIFSIESDHWPNDRPFQGPPAHWTIYLPLPDPHAHGHVRFRDQSSVRTPRPRVFSHRRSD